jgi:hypothetical protein
LSIERSMGGPGARQPGRQRMCNRATEGVAD